MYKNIFFDLDGTITDSKEGIINGIIYGLSKIGITDSVENLVKFIGPPLFDSFQTEYGVSPEQSRKAVEAYREYFKDKGIYENKMYPGAEELLKKLKADGYKLVLATSKPEPFALRILDYFDIAKYFDYAFGATFTPERATKALVIKWGLDHIEGIKKEETVMVGDREHDMSGAKANGLDCIGVSYGYGGEEELKECKATYIAKNFDELYKIIKEK
ncbi:MAG: HAD family hydrolase [Clostridiales bacterium]|nr:HAD family hydrolase [Clostridiales bacterium]